VVLIRGPPTTPIYCTLVRTEVLGEGQQRRIYEGCCVREVCNLHHTRSSYTQKCIEETHPIPLTI
jgi:hypothetical protein